MAEGETGGQITWSVSSHTGSGIFNARAIRVSRVEACLNQICVVDYGGLERDTLFASLPGHGRVPYERLSGTGKPVPDKTVGYIM